MAARPPASRLNWCKPSRPSKRKKSEFREPMEPIKTEIVVIGAGPGGYAAAFYAADKGKKVTLIAREKRLGGVCLNRGCIPSKALLHASKLMVEAKESSFRGITFGNPVLDLNKMRSWK